MARDRLAALRQMQGQLPPRQQQQPTDPQQSALASNYTINQAPGLFGRPVLRPTSVGSSLSASTLTSASSAHISDPRQSALADGILYDELDNYQGFASATPPPAPAPTAPQPALTDQRSRFSPFGLGGYVFNWRSYPQAEQEAPVAPPPTHSATQSEHPMPPLPAYSRQPGSAFTSRAPVFDDAGTRAESRDSMYSDNSGSTSVEPHASKHPVLDDDGNDGEKPPEDQMGPVAMDEFFETIANIQRMVKNLIERVDHVNVLHSRTLNAVPESVEYQRISAELDQATGETRALSNQLRSSIKELERTNGRAPSEQDANVKRSQTATVKSRFVEAIQRYSQVEAASRAAGKQRLGKTFKVIHPEATAEEVQAVMQGNEEDADNMFRQAVLQRQQRRGQAQSTLSAVQARQADIQRMEQTIVELAQLFQDMAVMVEEQDEMVEKIESQAAEAEKDMEIGHEHLVKAKMSALSARSKRKFCCGVVAILILALVGGILGYLAVNTDTFKHSNNNSSSNGSANDAAPSATESSPSASVAEPTPTSSTEPQQGAGTDSPNQQQPGNNQSSDSEIVFSPVAANVQTGAQQTTTPPAQRDAPVQIARRGPSAGYTSRRATPSRFAGDAGQMLSSIAQQVHGTAVAAASIAPRSHQEESLEDGEPAWMMERAVRFEERARAWPFVDTEAAVDVLDERS